MNSKELSKKLKQLEQEKIALRTQMDNQYSDFQAAMPVAAESWITKEVESKIKDNPDIVQSLGIEKLKELKSKIKALAESLPEIVSEEFQYSSSWPHHIQEIKEDFVYKQQKEPHLNRIFRNVISNLGCILDEFDLLKEPEGYVSTWKRVGKNNFRYAINPGMELYFAKSNRDVYWKQLKEYTQLILDIKNTSKSLDEVNAKELWDEA